MVTISRSLDLTGVSCPMNFVLVKQTLDSMPAGECLQVRLDRESVERDMAESLSGFGYDVVSVSEDSGHSVMVVRRRKKNAAGFLPRARRAGGCTKAGRRLRR